jgi:sugar-specific transcriptional regulator TrmB
MSSFFEQNPELLHMCNWGLSVYKLLEETGEATVDEISSKCNIPYSRVNVILDCLKQEGYVIGRGRKIKRYALRYKDPELSYLWCKEDKAQQSTP